VLQPTSPCEVTVTDCRDAFERPVDRHHVLIRRWVRRRQDLPIVDRHPAVERESDEVGVAEPKAGSEVDKVKGQAEQLD